MAMRERDETLVFPNYASIELGGSSHCAAVPQQACADSVREFGATTGDLNATAAGLLACGVDTVALASTGVYWIPVYGVRGPRGLKVWLVVAQQMDYAPGRKSALQDGQWLQTLMSQLGQAKVDLGRAPRACSTSRAQFDARQTMASWAGVGLTRINRLGLAALLKIAWEIGPNMRCFPSVKHFCPWLGRCPGTKISGDNMLSAKTKRTTSRMRLALKMAAMRLSHSDAALGAFYRRLCSRMHKPCANTAATATATAPKLARVVRFMMARAEAFVDEGQQRYEGQQRKRSIAAPKRHAAALGFQINPAPVPA